MVKHEHIKNGLWSPKRTRRGGLSTIIDGNFLDFLQKETNSFAAVGNKGGNKGGSKGGGPKGGSDSPKGGGKGGGKGKGGAPAGAGGGGGSGFSGDSDRMDNHTTIGSGGVQDQFGAKLDTDIILGTSMYINEPGASTITIAPPTDVAEGELIIAAAHTDGDESFNSTDWSTTYGWTIHDYKHAATGRGSHNLASFTANAAFVADASLDLGTGSVEHGGAMLMRFSSSWSVDAVDTQGIISATAWAEDGDLPVSLTTTNNDGLLLSFLFSQGGNMITGNALDANTGWTFLASQLVTDNSNSVYASMYVFAKVLTSSGLQTIGQPWTYTGTRIRTSATLGLSRA